MKRSSTIVLVALGTSSMLTACDESPAQYETKQNHYVTQDG